MEVSERWLPYLIDVPEPSVPLSVASAARHLIQTTTIGLLNTIGVAKDTRRSLGWMLRRYITGWGMAPHAAMRVWWPDVRRQWAVVRTGPTWTTAASLFDNFAGYPVGVLCWMTLSPFVALSVLARYAWSDYRPLAVVWWQLRPQSGGGGGRDLTYRDWWHHRPQMREVLEEGYAVCRDAQIADYERIADLRATVASTWQFD